MSLKNRKYWVNQAKETVKRTAKQTDSIVNELMGIYEEAAIRVETQINATFARYAINNNLTHAEASRLISGEEYKIWRKSLKDYLKDIAEDATSSKLLVELNTLSAKSQISRQEQLLSNIYREMMSLAGDSSTTLEPLLGDLLESNYYRSCYNIQRGIGLGFNVAKLNTRLIRQTLEYPWSQKHFSKAILDNTDKLAALAKREITLGFASGSSVQTMAKNINDVMSKGRSVAERLVRTECKYFANQAELMGYKANGIQKYRYIGGGEGGKCNCADLNGQVFNVNEAEAGINFPPIHPNCLCIIIAEFDMSLFDDKRNVTPLSDNIKFQEWQATHAA